MLSAKVAAFGFAAMSGARTAEFRRKPVPIREGGKPIPPTLLKASDEQTVAAVAALLSAGAGYPADRFDEWGIISAPRFPGRSQVAIGLDRFEAEGVWGVSPNLIPHFALHSPAGTLSLALGSHGPNLGIGGGTDSAIQGVLTALTWLEDGRLPGVWLVLSGYTPELVPGLREIPPTDSVCHALALAIVHEGSTGAEGSMIRIVQGDADPCEHTLNLAEAADRLELGTSRRPAESASIYRPHLSFPASIRPDAWTIAADPVSGLRVELEVSR